MALEKKEIEEYLEVMYRKKQRGEKITTTGIADELSISPASVSEMLKKLERNGFIRYTPYREIELTKKGEKIGRSILKKHHILEDFLMVFGLGRKRAHVEACALEHALSGEGEKVFQRAMKSIKGKNAKPLCKLSAGQKGKILYIAGGVAVRKRMIELGLLPGTVVKVLRMSQYGCPIELLVRGTEIAIGKGVAEKVYVEVVE